MDQFLKLLLATACCVIIAGGAYFAKSEWDRQHQAEQRRTAALQEENRKEAERIENLVRQQRRIEARRRHAIPSLERNHCHQQLMSLRVAVNQQTSWVDFYRDEVQRCIDAGRINREAASGLMQ